MKKAAKKIQVRPKEKVSQQVNQLQKYESRIRHANRRPRDNHGRFYKKGEAPGERAALERDKVSDKSKDVTKASNE